MVTTTTISPPTFMAFGRTGSPMRDELIMSEIIKQRQQLDLPSIEITHSNELLNTDSVSIWSLPTDCTALIHAFLASFSVIIVSELGDKTFIITAILAMKNSRLPVFLASASALLLMTILSVVMGVAVTVIPEVYTHYASIVLFLCFGLKMLKEAYDINDNNEESEFEGVERSLEDDDHNNLDKENLSKESPAINEPSKIVEKSDEKQFVEAKKEEKMEIKTNYLRDLVSSLHFASLFIKVFTMVFVAEWGDRSQISTVILAAREDVVGVFIGSFIGHVLCTGLAVVGGRFVSEMISVKTSK